MAGAVDLQIVGMLLGSGWVGNFNIHRGKTITHGIAGIGMAFLSFPLIYLLSKIVALPLVVFITLLMICLVCIGASSSLVNVPVNTLLQVETTDSKRGRVMSITRAGVMAATPISFGISGFLIESMGTVPLMFTIGILVLVGAVVTSKSSQIREMQ